MAMGRDGRQLRVCPKGRQVIDQLQLVVNPEGPDGDGWARPGASGLSQGAVGLLISFSLSLTLRGPMAMAGHGRELRVCPKGRQGY
jgi:hypothetical protein